jgi:Major capsid protein N-terminus/Large eukaryotic DNA virus major capsid protein
MSGALVQLSNPGKQNMFFTGEPDITYFKMNYSKHTNFAKESIRLDWTTDIRFNTQASIIIPRLGDLLSNVWLEIKMTKLPTMYPVWKGLYYPAEHLIKDVSLTIGGQLIDRHTSDWFRVYHDAIQPLAKKYHYQKIANWDAGTITSDNAFTETLYFPILFYFTRSPGLALPLISLYNTEVKLTFTFRDAATIGVDPTDFEIDVYADYIYLDSDERKRFLERDHEYVFEFVQTHTKFLQDSELPSESQMSTFTAQLPFRNPTKAIFWMLKDVSPPSTTQTFHGRYFGDGANTYLGFQPSQYSDSSLGLLQAISEKLAPIYDVRLTLDGIDRFSKRKGTYFNKVESYVSDFETSPLPGMYMFSFCLNPYALQPSGFCNFSIIDDIRLIIKLKKSVMGKLNSSDFVFSNAEQNARNILNLQELVVFGWSLDRMVIRNGMVFLGFQDV